MIEEWTHYLVQLPFMYDATTAGIYDVIPPPKKVPAANFELLFSCFLSQVHYSKMWPFALDPLLPLQVLGLWNSEQR